MTSRTRLLTLVAGIAGLGFAGASAWVHHRLLTDPSYTSFCDVNAAFNCSQVYLSQYGSFQGISTALFGLIWFGVAVLLSVFSTPVDAGAKRSAGAAGTYLFVWSTIGLAVVLYLAYASFFVLGTACLLCLGTYVAVIAIFVLSGMASSVPVSALPSRLGADLQSLSSNTPAFVATLVFVVGAGSVLAWFPKDNLPKAGQESPTQAQQAPPADAVEKWLTEFDAQPRVDVGVDPEGAKIVIVKWNDFQCPSCREGFVWHKPVIKKFEEAHPGAIKYVIKDFPLEGECNYTTPNMNHFAACEASAALRLARETGKAAEMEQWLFDNQARLTGDIVREGYSSITGRTDFADRYQTVLQGIRQDVSDGVALQIGQTPTYFINGVRVLGNLQPQWLEVLLDHELKKAGGQ
ncbi:MAG: vitamin K epoxide reductase family protein [Vicinamibacterales bacterium]|jgi:uncharacterized membrane protein